ncbi:MAG: PAS domain S-box protein [Prolixibacteraceae bacterium]|nr:PAS domain S-box protein [Prolixibacteraceae bacterium]
MMKKGEKTGIDEAFASSRLVLDYKALIENAGISIVITDLDGQYIFANSIAAGLLGCDVQDVVGKTVSDFLPPEVARKYLVRNRQLIQSGKGRVYEVSFGLPSGTKTFQITDQVLKDDQGNGFAIQSSGVDITERKQIKKVIRRNNEIFNQFLEYSPIYIFFKDENVRSMRLSRNYEKMLGRPLDEILGKTMDELFPSDLAKSMVACDLEILRSGRKVEVEEEFNGRYYSTLKFPIRIEGKPMVLAGFTIDITDRKLAERALQSSEEKFRKSFNSHPGLVGISTVDEGRYLDVNKNFCDHLGWKREEVIGRTSKELGIFIDFAQREEMIAEIRRSGSILNYDVKIRTKTGEVRIGLFSAETIEMDGKKCLLAQIYDITERRQAEEELKESEARLRELNATKDKFFSIIAHDLKSPFNSIIGFSNLLTRQIQEKDYNGIGKYATIIQNSSQNAMNLLLNLLEWSRSQVGKMEFYPQHLEMVSLIDDAIRLLEDSAAQKLITIGTELPPVLCIYADKAMIAAILRNLISNAIKFTCEGGEVVISAKQKTDELQITVSDNGVGMSRDAIEKLFRIDQNLTTLGTSKEKGTGLGLILCKEFIEKHGGKIWVDSEEGKGSRFYFTIPT